MHDKTDKGKKRKQAYEDDNIKARKRYKTYNQKRKPKSNNQGKPRENTGNVKPKPKFGKKFSKRTPSATDFKVTTKAYGYVKKHMNKIQNIARKNIMQNALEKYKKRVQKKFKRKLNKKLERQKYMEEFDKEKNGDLFQQKWANDEMDPFHDDMKNTVLHHCKGCNWTGLLGKHQINTNDEFWCTACKNDKKQGKILRYGPENNGFMEKAPECISKLNVTEKMLISRACMIGKIFRLTGGQLGYKGHIINIAQDVQKLASSLPRLPSEIETFVVCKPGQKIEEKQLRVRRKNIQEALVYLQKNNPMYNKIVIDENRLSQLPDDGIPAGFKIIYEEVNKKDSKVHDCGPNQDILEVSEEEKISSECFIGKLKDCRTEKKKIAMAFGNSQGEESHWVPQGEPLSEFNTPYLYSACFPDLFHNGKGDPTSPMYQRDLTWSKKIKHLMYFGFKNDDGTYTHPCEEHPMFAYASLNRKQRHEILRCSKVFLNNAQKYEGMTTRDIKAMMDGVEGLNLMKSLNHYTKSVSGSAGFWNDKRKELESAIEEKGAPTLFTTWSAADTHWKQLFKILTKKDEIPSPSERYKLLNKHPLIAGDFFKRRFMKYFSCLKKVLGIKDWWWRYEFQSRGSFHVHSLLWLENDPGIVNLVEEALKGHMASIQLNELEDGQMGEEMKAKFEQQVINGEIAKESCRKVLYMDYNCRQSSWGSANARKLGKTRCPSLLS